MTEKMCEKIGYARVSREDQEPQNQEIKLREAGVVKACCFVDKGVSGTVPAKKRPGFNRMLQYIQDNPGEVKVLYVWELSRLGRNTLDVLNVIEEIEGKHEVAVWSLSPTEAFTRTEDKNIRTLLLMIISWVATRERENLVARTNAGLDRARAKGKILGRPAQPLDWNKVVDMRDKGKSWPEIAEEMGVSVMKLYRYRKDHGLLGTDNGGE